MKQARRRLSYTQLKMVEAHIRKVWTPSGYPSGINDDTVAEQVAAALHQQKEAVSPATVTYLRKELGLVAQGERPALRLLTPEALLRIEESLLTHGRCVLVKTPRGVAIWQMENYMTVRNGAIRRKVWLQGNRGRRAMVHKAGA